MLTLLSNIYNRFVAIRNRKFDNGKYPITKLNCKVISIGNIIAGGTGKTPFTIFIAKLLLDNGIKVGVVGSGYGRREKGLKVVCDGNQILTDVNGSGDELALIALKLLVPIVVDDKKVNAAKFLNENFDVDVIIVDDGFQHRYLHRDLDIVLINDLTIQNPFTFPKGLLREPLENFKRADLVCLEENVFNNEFFNKIEKLFYKKNFKCLKMYFLDKVEIIDNIQGKAVLTCSIARPKEFENFVKSIGVEVVHSIFHKDHYDYHKEDVEKILYICKSKNANSLIVTEKDFVKLVKFKELIFKNNISLIVSEIEITINNTEVLTNLINTKCNFSI